MKKHRAVTVNREAEKYDPDSTPYVIKNERDRVSPVSRFIEAVQKNPGEFRVVAKMLEVKKTKEGIKHREKNAFTTKSFMHSISEANEKTKERVNKLKEQGFDYGDADTPSSAAFNQVGKDFIQILGGPFSKQLYMYDYLYMHAYCWYLKNHNPVAKHIVALISDFVMGAGFRVAFDDESMQDAWKEYEELSRIQERAALWCDELTTYGELMLRRYVQKGLPVYKSYDPSTVWEIVTNPLDIDEVFYYHAQFPTQYQMFTDGKIPTGEYVIEHIKPEEMLHYKINAVSNEKRGRSDLFPIIGYLKRLDDYTQFRVVKARKEAAYCYDVKVDGDSRDVNAYIDSTSGPEPEPGSDFVHNGAVERNVVESSASGSSADKTWEQLVSMCAIGVGIPVTYFGTMGDNSVTTRAGAVLANEPVMKKFQRRQELFKAIIMRIVKDWLESTGKSGNTFRVIFPEVLGDDRSTKIKDLVLAKTNGVMTDKMFCEHVAEEMHIENYDYAEVKKERDEAEEKMQQDFMSGNSPLSAPGVGDTMKPDSANRSQIKKDLKQ